MRFVTTSHSCRHLDSGKQPCFEKTSNSLGETRTLRSEGVFLGSFFVSDLCFGAGFAVLRMLVEVMTAVASASTLPCSGSRLVQDCEDSAMRKTALLSTAAARIILIAGYIVSDELTTITIQPDGSADWVRFQSNIRSTEKGEKGTQR